MVKTEQNRTQIAKKAMLDALEANLGIVADAVKLAGISRGTHYQWLKDDPEYREAVEDVADGVIDFAESKLHKLIKDEDTTAIIFFLKTKGKKRGYIEKTEVVSEVTLKQKPTWFDGYETKTA